MGYEARRMLEQDITPGATIAEINKLLAPIEELKLNLPKAIDRRQHSPALSIQNAAPPALFATIGTMAGNPALGYALGSGAALGTIPKIQLKLADLMDKGRGASKTTRKWATGPAPSMVRQFLERGHLTEEERKELGFK